MDDSYDEMHEPEHNFKHSLMRVLIRLEHPTITFADIAGFDEVKRHMQDVLDFFKMPKGSHCLEKERYHQACCSLVFPAKREDHLLRL